MSDNYRAWQARAAATHGDARRLGAVYSADILWLRRSASLTCGHASSPAPKCAELGRMPSYMSAEGRDSNEPLGPRSAARASAAVPLCPLMLSPSAAALSDGGVVGLAWSTNSRYSGAATPPCAASACMRDVMQVRRRTHRLG